MVILDTIDKNTDRWQHYVDRLTVRFITSNIPAYKTTHGTPASPTLMADALVHIFNHHTHHRGHVSACLTSILGPTAAPEIDYIYFTRDKSFPTLIKK